MIFLEELRQQSSQLEVPAYYFRGRCLPKGLVLPDSILAFYSQSIVTAAQSHARYLLVIPFTPVVYYVERSRYELQPGNALFLKPWQQHWHQPSNRVSLTDRLLITFELPVPQSYLPQNPVLQITDCARQDAELLLHEFKDGDTLSLAYRLIRLLSDLAEHPVEDASLQYSPVIADILRFIARNINAPLDVQTLADHAELSASHLRMLFRNEIGQSIGRYLAEQRLNIACNKLANSRSKVQEIALLCGYTSVYAFGHFFKNMTGVSPLEFRKHGGLPLAGDKSKPFLRLMTDE